jgi:hypothetical protein
LLDPEKIGSLDDDEAFVSLEKRKVIFNPTTAGWRSRLSPQSYLLDYAFSRTQKR